MTKEAKELLLKDLCGRLQSKVIIYLHTSSEITGSAIILNSSIYGFIEDVLNNSPYEIKEVKPYLRPMSSLTEEEEKEFQELKVSYQFDEDGYVLFDWLNSHHFDYRGLIEKGLAFEAPEGMYES